MNNIEFKRPGTGIPPNRFDFIEGKVVKNKIYKNSQIKLKDLEQCYIIPARKIL